MGFRAIAHDIQGRVATENFRPHRPSQSTHPIIPNANFAGRFFAPARAQLDQAVVSVKFSKRNESEAGGSG